MASSEGDVPDCRWEVPAPEAEVLLGGPHTGNRLALKLALKELVVRKELRLVHRAERRPLLPPKRMDILARDVGRAPLADGSLRAVLHVYDRTVANIYPDGTVGIPTKEFAIAVFRRYSLGLFQSTPGYVEWVVLPALERRGFLARERYRRLGVFGATRWVLTPEGLAAKGELEGVLAVAAPALRGDAMRGLAGVLRTLAPDAGTFAATFAAIDSAVDKACDELSGD
jgi:hypothetical protein